MKIGIVGKGGTGKTTVAALVARTYAARGHRVLAVDTDSNPNLALSLGLGLAEADDVPVLPRSAVVGSGAGGITPKELVATYGVPTPAGVTLLHALSVTEAGGGCACGGHASVRSLLGAAIEHEADRTVVDMEAGLEHLSRSGGTLAYADALVVVMDPTVKAVAAAARIVELAAELGIPRTYGVGNRARSPQDQSFFTAAAPEHGVPLVAVIPHDPDVTAAEREGAMLPAGRGAAVRSAVERVVDVVDSEEEERSVLRARMRRIDERLAELGH